MIETSQEMSVAEATSFVPRHNGPTAEDVAARIRSALEHVSAERLVVAPDCGMKYLSRDVAFAKLRAMVEGAALVRAELGD